MIAMTWQSCLSHGARLDLQSDIVAMAVRVRLLAVGLWRSSAFRNETWVSLDIVDFQLLLSAAL
jgi:hypothetical protein